MPAALQLLTETIQSLTTAARELRPLRAGKPVHPTALSRWSRYGIKTPAGPVTLETVYVAGRLVTSREAVQRFLRRVAEAKVGLPVGEVCNEVLHKSSAPGHDDAKAALDQLGI